MATPPDAVTLCAVGGYSSSRLTLWGAPAVKCWAGRGCVNTSATTQAAWIRRLRSYPTWPGRPPCFHLGKPLDGPLVFRLGGLPVPAIQVQGESQRGVGLSEALVQCQRLGRRCPGFEERILGRKDTIFPIAR